MANLGAIVVAFVLIGCSPPTVSFRNPTVAAAGQSAEEVQADIAACEKAAPPGSDERERTYQACMISRNYWTYVPVRLGLAVMPVFLIIPIFIGPLPENLPLEIRQTRPHDPAMIAGDLEECKAAARARAKAASQWDFRNAVLEAALKPCLDERGYAVRRWESKQVPAQSTVAEPGPMPSQKCPGTFVVAGCP